MNLSIPPETSMPLSPRPSPSFYTAAMPSQNTNQAPGKGHSRPMKALALTQPWASLMAIGAKTIETRSRPLAYIGDIAICATAEVWKHHVPEYAEMALHWLWRHRHQFNGYHENIQDLYLSLPFGKVVCVVEKTGCQASPPSLSTLERQLGDYSSGRYFYPTTNLRKLATPIPVSSRQGLYNLPPAVADAVRLQLTADSSPPR